MSLRSLHYSLFLLSIPGLVLSQNLQPPYATPNFATLGSSSWPSTSAWDALNSTVDGRLQAIRPYAAVCYTEDPLYDEQACQEVIANYKNDTAREATAPALLWTNWERCGFGNGCALNYSDPQPVSNATCYQGSTPPYSIAIYNATDASNVIKWATANNVKITVKNTGHDYLGRSAAPSTLQVWTHGMNSIAYESNFVPQGSSATPVPAMIIDAGAQVYQMYEFAAENNFTIVGGGCLTVGGAGFFMGGGHGPAASTYGLAVDSALEYEVVTADGNIRIANEAQNSDLFWALRGGGVGSWGIVTSITFQVYPQVSVGASLLTITPNATQDSDTLAIEFLSLVGMYQNQWLGVGIISSLIVFPNEYLLNFFWLNVNATLSDLYQFFDDLTSLSSNYTVSQNQTSAEMYPSVSASVLETIGPLFEQFNLYGASNQLASRLVPRSFLDPSSPETIKSVATAAWQGLSIANQPLQGTPTGTLSTIPLLILTDLPTATRNLVNMTGANPALYEASWNTIYAVPWTTQTSEMENAEIMSAVQNATNPLTLLGITGSYQNEGSAFEPNWQDTFFGYKYSQLSQIKQTYDPDNFFTTFEGVDFPSSLSAYECYALDEQEMASV